MVKPGRKVFGALAALAVGAIALTGCSSGTESEVIEENPDGIEEVVTEKDEGDREDYTEEEAIDGEVVEEEKVEETR